VLPATLHVLTNKAVRIKWYRYNYLSTVLVFFLSVFVFFQLLSFFFPFFIVCFLFFNYLFMYKSQFFISLNHKILSICFKCLRCQTSNQCEWVRFILTKLSRYHPTAGSWTNCFWIQVSCSNSEWTNMVQCFWIKIFTV